MKEPPNNEQETLAAVTLALLGDPTRLRLSWALLSGESSVNDLAQAVGAQPSAVSQHLARLYLARLFRRRRDGNQVFYSADNVHVRRALEEALYHADHVLNGTPDHPPRP